MRNSFSYRLIILFLLFAKTSFGQALNLPFFEDFSSTKTSSPTDSLWVKGSGVQINNTFGINAPSVGVATFDGKNANAIPYDFTNKNASGYTDSLVSKPINLQSLTVKDSVSLSFFGQKGGLGEIPDKVEGDSLIVLFKDFKQKWQQVWPVNVPDSLTKLKLRLDYDNNLLNTRKDSINKTPATLANFLALLKRDSVNYTTALNLYTNLSTFPIKEFSQQIIAVNNPNYFHADFQFCIKAKGRKSGSFDVWNIDYIYLNSKRNSKDLYYPDLAWVQMNASLLKRYSSMPLRQFINNQEKELNPIISATLKNLNKDGSAAVRYLFSVKDSLTKKDLLRTNLPISGTVYDNGTVVYKDSISGERILPLTSKILQQIKRSKADTLKDFDNTKPLTIKYAFLAIDNDGLNNNPINYKQKFYGIDLTKNDAITNYTVLDNYYAYDDGTAETSSDFTEGLTYGKVAVQFAVNKPDTVAAVNIYINPTIANITGQSISLQIYNSIKIGKDSIDVPNKVVVQKTIKIEAKAPNTFQRVTLGADVPIKANGIFYVGYTKNSSTIIPIGLDKNTPQFASKIFYSTSKDWQNNVSKTDTLIKGSLMIRPIMGALHEKKDTTSAEKILAIEEEKIKELIIFPNPNEGILHWNLENINTIKIYDLAGKEVFQKNIEINTNRQIDLRSLPMNTYFVNFSDGKKSYTKKIIIVK